MSKKHLRGLAAFAGAALLLTGPAMARTNWQGEVMFTAVNAACVNDGWRVGDHALATLLPANLDNNGAKSYLALHLGRRNAYSLAVNGKIAAGSAYSAVGINSAGASFTFSGKLPQYVQAPATLALTTSFVDIKGQIDGFAGVPGCTVTYEGSFVRRR